MAVTDRPIVQPCVIQVRSIDRTVTQPCFVNRWPTCDVESRNCFTRASAIRSLQLEATSNCETALEKPNFRHHGKWCDVSTNQLDVNSARCSFMPRYKSLQTAAEMAALLLLVIVTVAGITQGLPQCRDENNNTVDW